MSKTSIVWQQNDFKSQQKLCDAQWIVFITVFHLENWSGGEGGQNHSKEKGGRHDFSCIHIHIVKPKSLYKSLNKHVTSGCVCGCVHSHTECSSFCICLAMSICTCVPASAFVCIQTLRIRTHSATNGSVHLDVFFCSRTFGGEFRGDYSPASQRTRNHNLKPWEQSHYTNNYQTIPTTSLAAVANQSPQKQLNCDEIWEGNYSPANLDAILFAYHCNIVYLWHNHT